MKYLISVLLVAFACNAMAADTNVETIREITPTLTAVGALTNSATYSPASGKIGYVLGVYQGVTTQTNTCVLTQTMGSASTAVQVESLTAVANTVAYETVGAGDVSADVDDIIISSGETLTLTGTGADSTNVVYVIRV